MSSTGTTPSQRTWTVRLKIYRTTVLLHVEPLQTLTSLKPALLSALRETQLDGTLNGAPLPSSPDAFILAKPRDVYDYTKGWVRISPPPNTALDEDGKKKGKGAGADESVKGAGLRDNAVLAFKWPGSSGTVKGKGKRKAMDEDEALGLEDGEEEWDVVIPKYEDAYEEENSGDVGARKEYNG